MFRCRPAIPARSYTKGDESGCKLARPMMLESVIETDLMSTAALLFLFQPAAPSASPLPQFALDLLSIFQLISIFGSALLSIKLYTSGLYRRYRIFFVYMLFRVPYLAYFWYANRSGTTSGGYLYSFCVTEPIVMVFYLLVVLELYRLVLERHQGLYTLGRWAMYAAITISVTVSVLTFLHKLVPSTPEPSKRLFTEMAVERGLDLSLVLFILLIVFFLGRYPVPLSRNVIVHTGIYSVFFLVNAFALLLRTLFTVTISENLNLAFSGATAICTVAWCLLLSAKGEEVQINTPQFRPGSEERILSQLDALNATLLKVSQKK